MSTTRTRILLAARRLFAEGGVAALTTDALAREAGTSKRSLYATFGDRDAILEALFAERIDALVAELRAAAAAAGTVQERLAAYGAVAVRFPQQFPPGFWGELRRAAPAVAEAVRARRDQLAGAVLREVLDEGVARGEVRADLPVALMVTVADVLAEHLIAQDPPPGHTRVELAGAAALLLLEGLLVRRSS